jgi:hypothetical protein
MNDQRKIFEFWLFLGEYIAVEYVAYGFRGEPSYCWWIVPGTLDPNK